MSTLERAIQIAIEAHLGQKDKAGEPYILHPLRMLLCMRTEEEQIIAVLHDSIEDSKLTLTDLKREAFSKTVLSAIDCLTRRDGEPYEEYIDRVLVNPIARKVKLADLEDNMNIRRIINIRERDFARLKKYHCAWFRLSMDENL